METRIDSLATLVLNSSDATVSGSLASGIFYTWDVNWDTLLEKLPLGKYNCTHEFFCAASNQLNGVLALNNTSQPYVYGELEYTITCNMQSGAASSNVFDRQSIAITSKTPFGYNSVWRTANNDVLLWGNFGWRFSEKHEFVCDNPTLKQKIWIKFSCRQNNFHASRPPIPTPATNTTDFETRGIHVFQFKLMK